MSDPVNTEQVATTVAADNNYLQDPDLAQLLSRLAALLGHSVPVHRYGMMDRTADGMAMADLPRWRRAQELWVASFPSGIHHEKNIDDVQRGDFPVLWIADDESQVLLLRGKDSDLLDVETAQAMTQRGPKAHLVEFDGVGHAPTLVTEDQIAVVKEFLLA